MIRPLELSQVQNISGFWGNYITQFSEKGILSQWDQIVKTGRLENFYRVARGESGTHEGLRFNDSDLYKWLEGAAYIHKLRPNSKISEAMEVAIDAIVKAQAEDGYLFTQVQLNLPDWKWRNLVNMHEMYCLGHLFEAAVALSQNLDDDRLMEVSKKAVTHIKSMYGPDKKIGFCGHPEIEIALYRMTEATGDLQYAELADWMIDIRGQRPSPFEPEVFDPEAGFMKAANALILKDGKYDGAYAQDDKPIREQTKIVGHSVRAAYLYTAAAMSSARRNDEGLFSALQTIWDNLTQRRMYITGGMGSTGDNEGFTVDYDLPNLNAYAETCAGISLAMWGRRMFEASGSSDYLDTVERVTMNGVLSGVSEDTTLYYYDNPLESRKSHERAPWFLCACCPPNVARFVGSIVQYALWESEDTIFVGMPVDGTFVLSCGLTMTMKTNYPHDGKVAFSFRGKAKRATRLAVRIPDWSDEVNVDFPTSDKGADYENGFMIFEDAWNEGTTLSIDFEMTPKIHQAHPYAFDNLGRVAFSYGPSIYCAESLKHSDAPQLISVDLSDDPRAINEKAADGSPLLQVEAQKVIIPGDMSLYEEFADLEASTNSLNLIPYRTWNEKGASYMQVWLRYN